MITSLTLNGLDLLSSGFFVETPIDGLEAPSYRVSVSDSPGQSGGAPGASYYGQRPISITGTVRGDSPSDHLIKRALLRAACQLSHDAQGATQLVPLTIETVLGDTFTAMVVVRAFTNPVSTPQSSSFFIALIAPDAALYRVGAITTGPISVAHSIGVPWPWTWPVVFSPPTGGSGVLNNLGDVDTRPVLTFSGALTNPFVYLIEQGRGFRLNYVSAAGDQIVVDMKQHTIILNDSTELLSARDVTYDWLTAGPGVNTFALFTGSTSDTGTVEVTAQSAVSGL